MSIKETIAVIVVVKLMFLYKITIELDLKYYKINLKINSKLR